MAKERTGTKTPAGAIQDLYPRLNEEDARRLAELSRQLIKLNPLDGESITGLASTIEEAEQLRKKGRA